jgi:parvulin-like peptidyl-prolyl isomerase
MKTLGLLLISGLAFAQAPLAGPTTSEADPVVVTIQGKPWKKSEIERLVAALPQQFSANYRQDKKTFLEQLALMVKLNMLAEAEGMDKQNPHADRLMWNRMQYIATAYMNEFNMTHAPSPAELAKFYEEHKQQFAQAKLRGIFIAYGGEGKRNEEAAQKLAVELKQKAESGADFAELATQYSDDAETKAKGGQFPQMRPNDEAVPAIIKSSVFSLKPGGVTKAIHQPTGYYVFKLEDFVIPSQEDIRVDIFNAVQEEKFRTWMDGIRTDLGIQFNDEKYLSAGAPK